MDIHHMSCPACKGPLLVRLGSFPLNSAPGNKKLHLKCPLCGNGFHVGYVSEPYEKTVEWEAVEAAKATKDLSDSVAATQQTASSNPGHSVTGSASEAASQEAPSEDSWDDDVDHEGAGRSSNDDRSDSMNPNNEAYQAAMDNRSNQMNPNNPA